VRIDAVQDQAEPVFCLHRRRHPVGAFAISPRGAARINNRSSYAADRLVCARYGRGLAVRAFTSGEFRIDVFAASGLRLFSRAGKGDRAIVLPAAICRGMAIVRMTTANGATFVAPAIAGAQED
jgi:hypothetical protein